MMPSADLPDVLQAIQLATRSHQQQHACNAHTFEDGPGLWQLVQQHQPRHMLELGTGLATVAGDVDLTGAVPRYDVTGRLVGIELQSVMAGVPPVALTAQFAVVGSGFDPASAAARLRLDGRFTGWESEPGDTVALVAPAESERAGKSSRTIGRPFQ